MSAIGYDSGFYDRLDQFSRSLNHVLLASSGKPAIARDSDWNQILELIQTLASKPTLSIATASVAACIKGHFEGDSAKWAAVAKAVASRAIDADSNKKLHELAWSLDEERTNVLARVSHRHA
ncbi:MAG: hypothetical protein ACLQU3_09690 [Limisphaerales bacterium]